MSCSEGGAALLARRVAEYVLSPRGRVPSPRVPGRPLGLLAGLCTGCAPAAAACARRRAESRPPHGSGVWRLSPNTSRWDALLPAGLSIAQLSVLSPGIALTANTSEIYHSGMMLADKVRMLVCGRNKILVRFFTGSPPHVEWWGCHRSLQFSFLTCVCTFISLRCVLHRRSV